jgi:hypothetical protein
MKPRRNSNEPKSKKILSMLLLLYFYYLLVSDKPTQPSKKHRVTIITLQRFELPRVC